MPNDHAEVPTIIAPRASTAVTEIGQSRAVAEVQAAIFLARKFPRDEIDALDKITNAFARQGLAEVAKYSYARGGTEIEGPSIRSLEAIARLWGNIRTGVEELSREAGKSECRSYAWDLENQYYEEKTFTVRHVRDTKKGSYPITDERDLYELIANMGARRKRACLEAIIPDDVIQAAMDQAETTLKVKFEVTPQLLGNLLESFEKYGVTKNMIEQRIQRSLDAMAPAQAVQMKKIYTSLKDGMSKPEDWFDLTQAQAGGVEPPKTGTEAVKAKVRARQSAAKESAPKETPEPARTGGDHEPSSSPSAAGPGAPPVTLAAVVGYIENAKSREVAEQALDLGRPPALTREEYAAATAEFNKRWADFM